MELIKHPLLAFPDDIQHIIFSYALGNWQHDREQFQKAANACSALQLTCKQFAPINKIAQLMNFNDVNKNIFLWRAAAAGIPCLVKYAINNKATLNYIASGYTPLSSAVRCNNYRCCELILEAGADANKAEEDEEDIGTTSCIDIMFVPNNYQPIHLAAKNNNLKITKLLITYKADVNATTSFDDNALEISYRNHTKNKELINLLIQHGSIVPSWIQNDI